MAGEVHPRLMPIFEPLCVPAWATLTAPTSDRGSSRFDTGVLRISTAFYWLPPRLRLLLRRSNHFFSSGCSMSWKIATGIVLAAHFAMMPVSLLAQNAYKDWDVSVDATTVIASTSAKTGAMLSYMCRAGMKICRWGVVIPDADCRPGSVVPITFNSTDTPKEIDAICNALPSIEGVPGAGRSLMLLGEPPGIGSHLFDGSATASVRNTNGKVVRHRFSWNGWISAYSAMQSTLQHIDPERAHRSQSSKDPWSTMPRYSDPGFGKVR